MWVRGGVVGEGKEEGREVQPKKKVVWRRGNSVKLARHREAGRWKV